MRPKLAYHDYEGVALNLDERDRLVADLGDKRLMLLRNHGTLAVGSTAAEAWVGMHYLERACRQQVLALSAGRDKVLEAPPEAVLAVTAQTSGPSVGIWDMAWPGVLRQLDRALPGYDA